MICCGVQNKDGFDELKKRFVVREFHPDEFVVKGVKTNELVSVFRSVRGKKIDVLQCFEVNEEKLKEAESLGHFEKIGEHFWLFLDKNVGRRK
jgi:hypothetical protein